MSLFNVEAGPWAAVVILAFLALAFLGFQLTTWFASGLALAALIAVLAIGVYIVGRRIYRRMVFGGGR